MGFQFLAFISQDLEKDKPLKKRRDFGCKETTMKVLLAALLFACAYALASAFTLEQQLNYCQDKLAGAETAKVAAQNQLNTVLAAVSTLSNELKAAHKAGRIIQQQLDRCLR